MTGPAAPYRSQQVARAGFPQVLRAELTKLRTVRSWVVVLLVAALLVVAFAWVSAEGNHSRSCTTGPSGVQTCTSQHPPVTVGPDGGPVVDTFSFVHQRLSGDGTITARVTSLAGAVAEAPVAAGPGGPSPGATSAVSVPWAKAGLIIKESTSQGSTYAAIMVTPGHGVRMQHDFTHDSAGDSGPATQSSPRWLRLTRAGDLITGYDSRDGVHWTKVGTASLNGLPADVQAGLFVTSPGFDEGAHEVRASTATATIDELGTTGGFSGDLQPDLVSGDPESYPTQGVDGGSWYERSGDTFTISGSGDIAPQVGGGVLAGTGETNSLQAGAAIGLLAVIVLATLFMTSEYRRRLIATTLTATPRRGQVLLAKAVVLGSGTFMVTAAATAIAMAVARHVLLDSGNYLFPVSAGADLRVVTGTGLLYALAATLTLAVATMLRRSAGTVVTGTVLFVLPFVLGTTLSASTSSWLFRVTPTAGFAVQDTLRRYDQVANAYTIANGHYPLSPWLGMLVLAGWTAIALTGALWLLRRRDA